MRVSQLKSFIKDEELVGIALGQSVKKDMIKTTDIANNFLKLPEDTKSSCVERLFTAIRENPTKEAKRLQEKLISVIKNKYTAADKSDLWDKHCAALDKQNLEKKMERFVRKTGKATLFREKLHTKSVKLSELKDQRDLFVNNPKWKKKTKKLIDKASVHNEVDTFYKFTPLKEQHFIISSLPRSVDQAYRYMDTAIRTKKCNLFVSCNELKDGQKAKHKEKNAVTFGRIKKSLVKVLMVPKLRK